jgi:hypothetical protein
MWHNKIHYNTNTLSFEGGGGQKKLTKIVVFLVGYECLAKATDIRMIERLQNADLPPKRLELMTIIIMLSIGMVAIAVAVPGGGDGSGSAGADLVPVDDFNGEPFARLARHGFHHGGKRAATKFVRHVVVRVDACQLTRCQVSVDVSVVFERVLLWHWRAKRDFIAIPQDARLALWHASPVDLCVMSSPKGMEEQFEFELFKKNN